MTRPHRDLRRPIAVAALALVIVSACSSPAPSAAPSFPLASPSATVAAPSTEPSSTGPSAATGGKVAEALVAALHANPFIAKFDESVLSSSLTGGTRITLSAKASGDVSGRDVDIHSTTTGGGPATDRRFVSVGDVAWSMAKGDASWTVHRRSDVAASIDQLLATVQIAVEPSLLVDTGVEDLDGQAVHHLTAAGGIPFQLPGGVEGDYATFDVWVTATGTPVLVKATFAQFAGINSITGGVDIRFSKVGGPITIAPPAGAPALAP